MATPTIIVIYGASGDLTHRKLMPALYNLWLKKRLPDPFFVIGLGRTDYSNTDFRQEMREAVAEFAAKVFTEEVWADFEGMLHYLSGNFTGPDPYPALTSKLAELENERQSNRLFYLAMPPRFYEPIINQLGEFDLVREEDEDETGCWRRVIIEKPFGRDLQSAQDLNVSIHQHLLEHQIYRIDHYLAKETVQNMMVFRFGNSIFEPLWNRNFIDHVQITAMETVDVGRRASYYDQAGVMRDMFQNHLMQLFSIVAMEPPSSRRAEALRNEKVKVLAAVRRLSEEEVPANTVRAQYEGYLTSDGVPADSTTPTYAAVQLYVDNWRWQGVPFYLRSGKALASKLTEITIQFKSAPVMLFAQKRRVPGNTLTLTIQPDEGIHLRMEAKVPDTLSDLQPVNMHFHYDDAFDDAPIPEAYERLLSDAIKGDASLFTRDDEVELSWKIIDPIMTAWRHSQTQPLTEYVKGSWGPVEADRFLAETGRAWVNGAHRRHIVHP
ncbi:MAG: glucose-6-phosphate dehydrogenase [Ardenticatenaceae bacterium]|nr:glucose-6-phosphate dehydrogenase [Ardenticatenaceae bacterium]